MLHQRTKVPAQEKFAGHPAQCPFAESAVVICAGNNQVGSFALDDRRELGRIEPVLGRRHAFGFYAVPLEPTYDVRHALIGLHDIFLAGYLDHDRPLGGLQHRHRIGHRAPRLAGILPGNEDVAGRKPGGGRRDNQQRPPRLHHEIADIHIGCAFGQRSRVVGGNNHHIRAALLFKGTEKRTALDISREIEAVGGVLNAFTSREYTCFYAKVLNKDLPLAIDLLSDMFLNSVFDRQELEKERMVVLQEIKMVEDTPDDLIHDLFAERFWKDHPLGWPVLGTKKTISSISRENITAYFKEQYISGN